MFNFLSFRMSLLHSIPFKHAIHFFKKNGKVFTSKSVGTGPSSYKKLICRAAFSQSLRNTGLEEFY